MLNLSLALEMKPLLQQETSKHLCFAAGSLRMAVHLQKHLLYKHAVALRNHMFSTIVGVPMTSMSD